MAVYLYKRTENNPADYEEVEAMVINAPNETRARELAFYALPGDQRAYWGTARHDTLECIGTSYPADRPDGILLTNHRAF